MDEIFVSSLKWEKLGQCRDFKKNKATFVQDFKDCCFSDITSFLFREVKENFFYKIMVIVDNKGIHIQDYRTGNNSKLQL